MTSTKILSPAELKAIDVHVGKRIREQRLMSGMSQENLGDALGVSFQQIQKYEKGTNRITASRLVQMSNALEKPVWFFFEGAPKMKYPVTSTR